MAEIELDTKIYKKDNLDITFSISGKKNFERYSSLQT